MKRWRSGEEMLTNANIFNQNGTNDFRICPIRPANLPGIYNTTPGKQNARYGENRHIDRGTVPEFWQHKTSIDLGLFIFSYLFFTDTLPAIRQNRCQYCQTYPRGKKLHGRRVKEKHPAGTGCKGTAILFLLGEHNRDFLPPIRTTACYFVFPRWTFWEARPEPSPRKRYNPHGWRILKRIIILRPIICVM